MRAAWGEIVGFVAELLKLGVQHTQGTQRGYKFCDLAFVEPIFLM